MDFLVELEVCYTFFDNATGDEQLRRDRFLISEKMVQFRYILKKGGDMSREEKEVITCY